MVGVFFTVWPVSGIRVVQGRSLFRRPDSGPREAALSLFFEKGGNVMKEWRIQANEMVNCNCNYGCPCQFGVLPTDGICEAAGVFEVSEGHHGDVSLDGVRAAVIYKWPGAIHEGNGEMQIIVDEAASDGQVAALEAVMTGQDTEEMATMWYVFSAMSPHRHKTLRASIDARMDAAARTGKARVGDVFELEAKPIPHIVTGQPHRVKLALPHGMEFSECELASGRTRTMEGGAIALERNHDTHAHFARLHLTGNGVVHA